MGYKDFGGKFSFADLAMRGLLEHNRSVKMLASLRLDGEDQ